MADTSAAAEHLALAFVALGMQRMPSRVWATILCADQESVTAGEIAEELGVSAGAVSGALRMLLGAKLIIRVPPPPGSRREHYGFPEGTWARMMMQREDMVAAMRDAADEGIEAAGRNSIAGRRLSELRHFYEYIDREMPLMLARWEEQWRAECGRAEQGPGGPEEGPAAGS